MDPDTNTDNYCLVDEKFDFDVSSARYVSRGDEEEDDDEVFLGPVSDKEKCISAGMESQAMDNVSAGISEAEEPSWSLLTRNKFELICKEAHQLASQLKGNQQEKHVTEETFGTKGESQSKLMEEFVEDTMAKLGIFNKPAKSIVSPIKRETFCLQDSPKKQLPPVIQQRLIRGSRSSSSDVAAPLTKGRRRSTSSPVSSIKTQSKMALRGRAGLGTGGVLPSKPAAPAIFTSTPNTANTRVAPAEKTTRLPPPNKAQPKIKPRLASWSREGSCEDLLSDSASVASDVSDSSLNSSLLRKPALAHSIKNLSAVKAPSPQTRGVVKHRRNTSSSVSSFNNSLSESPTGKGKRNSSLNSSVSGPSGRASCRLTNPSTSAVKAKRSSICGKPAGPPTTSTPMVRCSMSTQARKPSEVDQSKPTRSTPLKRPEPCTPVILTPSKRAMARTSSVPIVSSLSTPKLQIGASKTKAVVVPTPTGKVKGPRQADGSSPDAPQILKPERRLSACSMDRLSQKQAVTPSRLLNTPSAGANKSLPTKMRRPSALPTPVKQRISGVPVMTPKSSAQASRSFPSMSVLPTSASRSSNRSAEAELTASGEELVCSLSIQPFCLEENDKPNISPPVVPQPETQEKACPGEVGQEGPEQDQSIKEQPDVKQQNQEAEPNGDLIELQSTDDTHPQDQASKTKEVLLIDIPAPVLRPKEKLLIDLSNTPDLIRTASVKHCDGKELIDLSSPLIKWSPEDKKENVVNEPRLINFSF
ncbi:G2 and S phase-expressed protein 1 [Lampris incognitus]|uniref:G2 and S phase-expressed protein 1 n=1 Tax=Lampris incognitus TaxID=2546036 RepID=UPI0024B4B1CD|nr:G2 and S phase-expressed protein 1 [Lampris incognitus]